MSKPYAERQALIDEYFKELGRTLGHTYANTFSLMFIQRRFRLTSLLGHVTTFTTRELKQALATLKTRPNA